MKTCFFFFALAFSFSFVHAQTVGIKIGADFDAPSQFSSASRNVPSAIIGGSYNIQFCKRITASAGLDYFYYGNRHGVVPNYFWRFRSHSLQLPISISYTLLRNKSHSLNWDASLGGGYRYELSSVSTRYVNNVETGRDSNSGYNYGFVQLGTSVSRSLCHDKTLTVGAWLTRKTEPNIYSELVNFIQVYTKFNIPIKPKNRLKTQS